MAAWGAYIVDLVSTMYYQIIHGNGESLQVGDGSVEIKHGRLKIDFGGGGKDDSVNYLRNQSGRDS